MCRILICTVEISPVLYPINLYKSYNNVAHVVLPLVPVIPTSFSFSEGLSKKFEATIPKDFELSKTLIYVISSFKISGRLSQIIAHAPLF